MAEDDAGVIGAEDFPAAMAGDAMGDAMVDEGADPYAVDDQGQPDAMNRLIALMNSQNIALEIESEKLGQIGAQVVREFDIDKASRKEWEEKIGAAMDIALQVVKAKNYPWPGAANVKFPLMTTAAMQFAARAYPAVVPPTNLVKGKVIGADPQGLKRQKGDRVATHMSWQLTEEMEEWEEDTDTLLHMVPIVGCVFRKTWFDAALGRNRSELIGPMDCVVNYGAKSLTTCPRVTQVFKLYPYEIIERTRMGLYRDCEYGPSVSEDADSEDQSAPHDFLEQHRKLDLDDDGYEEPYIVTIHKETSQVVRIVAGFGPEGVTVNQSGEVAKIEPERYFTKYGFVPSPDGGFYDVGFGVLLNPINEAVNTTLNQLLDAGHLQNTGGGFIGSGLRMRTGVLRFTPGEYKVIQASGPAIAQNIVPLQFPGPSPVLFQLLGLLIEAGKEVASIKDILLGDNRGQNMTATATLALIEQGMQVFTAIYKRLHRSLKQELKKLFRLNRLYMQPEVYYTVLDEQAQVAQADYDEKSVDVIPVSDPKAVSDMQKMARTEFLLKFVDDPTVNRVAIVLRAFEAAGIDKPEELFAKPAPNPMLLEAADKLDIERDKVAVQAAVAQAQIAELLTRGIKNIADAEESEAGVQMQEYRNTLDALMAFAKARGEADDRAGRIRGLVEGRRDAEGDAVLPGPAAGPGGVVA